VTVEIRVARAEEIRELRRDVLRPGGSLDPSAYDLDSLTLHVGAFDGEAVVGCASFFPEPYEDEPAAWRLRGMAVDPARQGQGIGAKVLAAGTDAVRQAGGTFIWATARVTAMPFYLRLGWESVGDVFDYGPAQLPHLVMLWRG
jgi:predicted N-acetyltransferase YhbS